MSELGNISPISSPLSEDDLVQDWGRPWRAPLVSIVCCTFNQDRFIEKALVGFFSQKTDFPFEVIIQNDASTDSTKEIIDRWRMKYPRVLRVFHHEANKYQQGVKVGLLAASRADGHYVAFCDGDDYWIDGNKLQRQIELFRGGVPVALVHTNCMDLEGGYLASSIVPREHNSFDQLLRSNGVRTCTAMFRKADFEDFMQVFSDCLPQWRFGDWALWLFLSSRGAVVLDGRTTAVYRVQGGSVSHNLNCDDDCAWEQNSLNIRWDVIKTLKGSDLFSNKRTVANDFVKARVRSKGKIFVERKVSVSYASLPYRLVDTCLSSHILCYFLYKLLHVYHWVRKLKA